MQMSSERFEFANADGRALSAVLNRPEEGVTRGYALVAHCFTCSKDLRGLRNLARGLNEVGLATVRFDFTGLGQSEGAFEETTFASDVEEVVRAARMMRERYEGPGLLVGHSLGGAAVLSAAGQIESARAVATVAAPSEPAALKRHLAAHLEEVAQQGRATVKLGGRPFEITEEFVADLEGHDLRRRVAELGIPLLVMHAPDDRVTAIDHATALFQAAEKERSFISLDGMDHLLSDDEDARYVGRLIGTWASRFMG